MDLGFDIAQGPVGSELPVVFRLELGVQHFPQQRLAALALVALVFHVGSHLAVGVDDVLPGVEQIGDTAPCAP